MGLALITPPPAEPVTLAEARSWLKLDTQDDDPLVAALVTAARMAVEAASGCILVSQTWRWSFDAWPPDPILSCPLGPVSAVAGIGVADATGSLVALPASRWSADIASQPARVALAGPLPVPGSPLAGIAIDLVCGFGPLPASVPEPLRMAVRLMLAFLYENRGEAGPVPMPLAAASLAEPYRTRRL